MNELKNKFGNRIKKISEIADVICGPFGSAIKKIDYKEEGIPLIRISNITKDGYLDYADIVYISEELSNNLVRTQVLEGDIVISQRGSLGQCAIVDGKYEKLNISANIIAIKNIKYVSAVFLRDYMLSVVGQTLLERSVSGQVQQKITTQDIGDVLVPLDCDEKKLIKIMEEAYDNYSIKLEKTNKLLEGLSEDIFSKLNIEKINFKEKVCCSVRLYNVIEDSTFSANYYHPERMAAIHALKTCRYPILKLIEIVDFCRDEISMEKCNLRYLGLAGVESHTGELNNSIEETRGKAFIYQKDDVLYGRLRPYLNKVLFAEEGGVCSTEFHVLRVKDNSKIIPEYLACIMRSELVLAQTRHMMTGNTHPRISNDDVKNLYIPTPSISIQCEIVKELRERRIQARNLKYEAEKEWHEAKLLFEKKLLGE